MAAKLNSHMSMKKVTSLWSRAEVGGGGVGGGSGREREHRCGQAQLVDLCHGQVYSLLE